MDPVDVAIFGHRTPILTYLADGAQKGDLVLVPFRNRITCGIVVGRGAGQKRLKRINKVVVRGFITEPFLKLSQWISAYYLCPIEDVVRGVIPRSILPVKPLPPLEVHEMATGPDLNRWQKNAVAEMSYAVENRISAVFLLYGITGSGKTEVYVNLILKAVEKGLGAILLYPEIALTPLYKQRFEKRFPFAVLHSNLSIKQRRTNWHLLRNNCCSVAIGPRSAIFAPINNVGIIIVDEEHSTSYKEEFHAPRYHAREVAIARGRIEGCPVILGSATPAIETYHKAMVGDYRLIRLPGRTGQRALPRIRIIDVKREKEKVFTNQILIALRKTFSEKNQAIIFLNRKGYAPVVICKDCGNSILCRDCGIPLVYHRRKGILRCPYCNHERSMIKYCPECHSGNIKMLGLGTERIEERLTKIFGQETVVRMDKELVRRELFQLYTQFLNRDRLLMVGTSLVTKGHDFPFVTLVGVINGDQVLNFPDFRSGELTFQTLTQVAGRAGRGNIPGEVYIQTYRPDHYVFQAIREHSYERFYSNEIKIRKDLDYPPFSRIILLRLVGPDQQSLMKVGKKIIDRIPRKKGLTIVGPAQAFRRKISKNYHQIIMLKIKGDHRWLKDIIDFRMKGMKVLVDVDPISVI